MPDDGHGHLAEMRVDPIGLFERVRDECGDIGRFRLADRDVVLVSGAEANEQFFRAPGQHARPGRRLPVHDADLRPGRGVRRLARGTAADAEEPGTARRHDARPRRHHRGRDPPDGGRLGRRGRDRPARLVRRADDLHDVVVPDRQAVPRGARRLASPSTTTTSSAAPTRWPTSTRTPTSSSFAIRDAAREQLVALVQGIIDSRQARGHGGQGGARPARRAHLDRHDAPTTITGIFISMMFAGHHTSSGHGGLDADRAAAQPRDAEGRRRRARRPLRRRLARSRSRHCARSRGWRRRSRRRCGCTRRW